MSELAGINGNREYTRKDEEDNKHLCIWVDKLNVLFVVLYSLGWMGLELDDL